MVNRNDIGGKALGALRSEPRIGPHFKPEVLDVDADGVAVIEAEVDSVAAKLALTRLASVPGVSGIVDRLRVKPALAMSDDGILDHLRKAYYQEPAFQQSAIEERKNGQAKLVRACPARMARSTSRWSMVSSP